MDQMASNIGTLQADEELEIWVFFDLLDQFFIREPMTGLDDLCIQA